MEKLYDEKKDDFEKKNADELKKNYQFLKLGVYVSDGTRISYRLPEYFLNDIFKYILFIEIAPNIRDLTLEEKKKIRKFVESCIDDDDQTIDNFQNLITKKVYKKIMSKVKEYYKKCQ